MMAQAQTTTVPAEDLREVWPVLDADERVEGFLRLDRLDAEDFFLTLSPRSQAQVILGLPAGEQRLWMRLLAPDDAADVLQEVEGDQRELLLGLLDETTRHEVNALLAYAEDDAGGLMNPRFARLRPDMTIDEAISYLRLQAREQPETIYYVYVLDRDQRLLGVVSFRELLTVPGGRLVQEVMHTDFVSVPEEMDQEEVARLIGEHNLMALPVVDAEGRIRGIVTVDDIVDVVQEEATEDIQKLGGMEALDTPYLQTGLGTMLKKRGGWLSVLFVGEMLTTLAMGQFESTLAQAVVLALFMPLIISSGGNSGSQAATLVIRAMALEQVRLRDWFRIVRREALVGLLLGLILAALGVIRIAGGEALFGTFGDQAWMLGVTVAVSLVGVVLWGTLSGSMLPFLIRRLGFDPASASAPFVATMVDVVGLLIYFGTARAILAGSLL